MCCAECCRSPSGPIEDPRMRKMSSPARAGLVAGLLFSCTGFAAADTAAVSHSVVDVARSSLEFSFVQAGAQNKGKFNRFTATLDFSPDNPGAGKLDVIVEMASVDTGDKE